MEQMGHTLNTAHSRRSVSFEKSSVGPLSFFNNEDRKDKILIYISRKQKKPFHIPYPPTRIMKCHKGCFFPQIWTCMPTSNKEPVANWPSKDVENGPSASNLFSFFGWNQEMKSTSGSSVAVFSNVSLGKHVRPPIIQEDRSGQICWRYRRRSSWFSDFMYPKWPCCLKKVVFVVWSTEQNEHFDWLKWIGSTYRSECWSSTLTGGVLGHLRLKSPEKDCES